jgi:hypothetical protein
MKGFVCWKFFLGEKHVTSMGTLMVKTVEYAVLKTDVLCMEAHCIRLRLVFGVLCREDGRDNCCETLSRFFTHFFALLEEYKRHCWL